MLHALQRRGRSSRSRDHARVVALQGCFEAFEAFGGELRGQAITPNALPGREIRATTSHRTNPPRLVPRPGATDTCCRATFLAAGPSGLLAKTHRYRRPSLRPRWGLHRARARLASLPSW